MDNNDEMPINTERTINAKLIFFNATSFSFLILNQQKTSLETDDYFFTSFCLF